MCLDYTTEGSDLSKSGTAYKVFRKLRDGSLSSPYFLTLNCMSVGKTYREPEERVNTPDSPLLSGLIAQAAAGGRNPLVILGWYCFVNKEAAIYLCSLLGSIYQQTFVVHKVNWKKQKARGLDSGRDTIVAEEMKIGEVVTVVAEEIEINNC